jgi:2-oxo-4-hydroxy-4-carboxy-5-ureidoimidazoline decarboxylase
MTIQDLNHLPPTELKETFYKCCGSTAWVNKMMGLLPMEELVELLDFAEEQWYTCTEDDWREAFSNHPKIGDLESLQKKFATTAEWAGDEQGGIHNAGTETIKALADANKGYEKKFGYIFIISASGKSAEEMLGVLEERLKNDPATEINMAAEEQNKITLIRLQKLLQ